jgi:hypothetical protein
MAAKATAPIPTPKGVGLRCEKLLSYQFRLHRNDNNGGHGNAVSLPRLIVGTRYCRVLTVGYINSDTNGFDIMPMLNFYS